MVSDSTEVARNYKLYRNHISQIIYLYIWIGNDGISELFDISTRNFRLRKFWHFVFSLLVSCWYDLNGIDPDGLPIVGPHP